ncbi:MAG: ASCH domain-containing protein [Candidatus Doudnabacteria bacterium]|nr:ASCH domain-containing protein [Candidatus Doudnabacteria bacterium]
MNKEIGFAPDLVKLVKSGEKTKTYRLGNKYDFLNPGDVIPTKNSESGEVFAELKITNKAYTTFKDLPLNNSGHEIYGTKEEQRNLFEKYYGRKVEDDEFVIVLSFEVTKLF